MDLYFRLAWRNLWRNKRRTLISVSSIFFAVLLALVMRSMQHGSYDYMIASSVRMTTGYLQIHAASYWEKKSIDYSFPLEEDLLRRVRQIPHVTAAIPRVQSFILAASAEVTRAALVTGTDPVVENDLNRLSAKLVRGRYLHAADRGLLIGRGLADHLKVDVGDSLVLYGLGYHGMTAAARYPVLGVLHFPIPDADNALLYLPLSLSQALYALDTRVNTVSLMVDDIRYVPDVKRRLTAMLGPGYEVMSWDEMSPELVQEIEIDNAGGLMMLAILYVIIGFGILGTVMMMMMERRKEYGILLAVGMRRARLIMTTWLEILFLSFTGVVTGVAAGIPLIYYFHLHPIPLTGAWADTMLKFGLDPIMPFAMDPGLFGSQAVVVLVLAVLSGCYPAMVLAALDPVRAMRL